MRDYKVCKKFTGVIIVLYGQKIDEQVVVIIYLMFVDSMAKMVKLNMNINKISENQKNIFDE